MSERKDETEGVSCTYCNHFMHSGEEVCPRCGNVRFGTSNREQVSATLGSLRDSVRKAVKEGLLTEKQGDLLNEAIMRACQLNFERRKQLLLLTKTIAEENDALKRKELAARFRNFVAPIRFPNELISDIEESFGLR